MLSMPYNVGVLKKSLYPYTLGELEMLTTRISRKTNCIVLRMPSYLLFFVCIQICGCSLDKVGRAVASKCEGFDTYHNFDENKNRYVFLTECDVSTEEDVAGPTANFQVNAKWDVQEKVAKETIEDSTRTTQVNTVAECPDDPWLNAVSCSTVNIYTNSTNPQWDGFIVRYVELMKMPLSATLLGNKDRKRLNRLRTDALSN